MKNHVFPFFFQPTLVTGYSAVDQASHDAQNLPFVLRKLSADWILPLQPNPYSIKVKPDDSETPPMLLWAPPGCRQTPFHGTSAKNAGKSFIKNLKMHNADPKILFCSFCCCC